MYEVDETTGCWNWTRCVGRNGYGYHNNEPAHRYIYKQMVGSIPDGFQIHHRCRNRKCVNPDHMLAVDRRAHGGKDADLEYWKNRAYEAERKLREATVVG